jgi:hypothetical protein
MKEKTMSQRNLNFSACPVGTLIITPGGEVVVKNGADSATSADPELGVLTYRSDEEVQVDVEQTILNLTRAVLMNSGDFSSAEFAAAVASTELFMTLIGEL